jgi:hypothetical protein
VECWVLSEGGEVKEVGQCPLTSVNAAITHVATNTKPIHFCFATARIERCATRLFFLPLKEDVIVVRQVGCSSFLCVYEQKMNFFSYFDQPR